MESVSRNTGTAGMQAEDGLRAAVVVDTEKARGHLDEVVRSTWSSP